MDFYPGAEIWIRLQGDIQAAVVTERTPLRVRLSDAEKPIAVVPSDCFPRVAGSPVPDCCNLVHLDEASMLWNLRERYAADDIYTTVCSVLLSVNPYKSVAHLYTEDVRQQYCQTSGPHPYALANQSYNRMLRDRLPQAILISGESGSGKTESAKVVMSFLGARSRTDHVTAENLQAKVLTGMNPILEAFGNATTVRNDNSSRFGKFNSLIFNRVGSFLGSRVHTFLLESNRVVQYGANERTYHIFYEMFFHPEVHSFALDPTKKYRLLGTMSRRPRADETNFNTLVNAFAAMDMSEESIQIFQVLAALIHLGEIEFREREEQAYIVDLKPITHAARLLGFSEQKLQSVLLSKTIIVKRGSGRNSIYTVPFRKHQANHTLHSLMKTIYSRMFDYIVRRLNHTAPPASETSIGILDIYGFEQLETNSLEQLCINLANEALQQYFIVNCMESEQKTYISEGLRWTPLDFPDNGPVVNTIRNLFSTLDNHGRLQAKNQHTSDDRLTTDILKCHGSRGASAILTEPRRKNAKSNVAMGFVVQHYAGKVTYETEFWLEKNNSRMTLEQEGLLSESTHGIVPSLADTMATGFSSVCTQYWNDLKKLLDTISSSGVQYIRCFKPNDSQQPNRFETRRVLGQMVQCGTIQLMNVMHYGWPCRCRFEQLNRFRSLLPDYFSMMDSRTFIEALMMAFGVPKADFCLGASKLFMKSGKMAVLDNLKDNGKQAEEMVLTTVKRYIRRKKLTRCMHALGFLLWYKKHVRKTRLNTVCAALLRASRNLVRVSRWLGRARTIIRRRNAEAGCRKLRLACITFSGLRRWVQRARRALRQKEVARLLHLWWRASMLQVRLRRWARVVIRSKRRRQHLGTFRTVVCLSVLLKRARARVQNRSQQADARLHTFARGVFLGIHLRRFQRKLKLKQRRALSLWRLALLHIFLRRWTLRWLKQRCLERQQASVVWLKRKAAEQQLKLERACASEAVRRAKESLSGVSELDLFVGEPSVEFPLEVNVEGQGIRLQIPCLGLDSNNSGNFAYPPPLTSHALRTKCLLMMFKNYALCIIYLKRWAVRWKARRTPRRPRKELRSPMATPLPSIVTTPPSQLRTPIVNTPLYTPMSVNAPKHPFINASPAHTPQRKTPMSASPQIPASKRKVIVSLSPEIPPKAQQRTTPLEVSKVATPDSRMRLFSPYKVPKVSKQSSRLPNQSVSRPPTRSATSQSPAAKRSRTDTAQKFSGFTGHSQTDRVSLLTLDYTPRDPRTPGCANAGLNAATSVSPLLRMDEIISPLSSVCSESSPRLAVEIFSPMSDASNSEQPDSTRKKFAQMINTYMENVNSNEVKLKSNLRKSGWTVR